MKKYIFNAVCAAVLSVSAFAAMGQNTATGYFVDQYTYRFQMNPAMGNDRNFVGMPGLANLNVGLHGNLGVSDVLYKLDGRTTTLLNPGISVAEAMGNLSNVNRLGADVRINVLAFGFKAWGGYNTFTVNARTNADVKLPKSLFSLAKEGIANNRYDISDVGVRASLFAEVAIGHSRDINSEWRVGGNLKVLVGGANIEAKLDNAMLELGEDDWRVTSEGELSASIKGLAYDHDVNDNTGHEYVSGMDVDNTGINGYGVAVDLGAVYRPRSLEGLTLSASLLDLGFINWSNNMLASTNGVRTFNTDRYTFNPDDDADNSFDNEWDRLTDDFAEIYELDDMGDQGSVTRMLGATFNIGGEYELPVYRNLTFGLLNTTRISGSYSWTDFRLSANLAPCKVFSCAASIGEGTYGFSFGWVVNLHAPGFNLFLGMDRTPNKLSKEYVPLSSNVGVNLGMNFLF